MKNVISINRNKLLGAYIDAQNKERIPEDAYFYAGVFLWVLLPQLTLFLYGGITPLIIFAACALGGSLLGVAKYYSPSAPPSIAGTVTKARVPPRQDSSRKRA